MTLRNDPLEARLQELLIRHHWDTSSDGWEKAERQNLPKFTALITKECRKAYKKGWEDAMKQENPPKEPK